MKFTHSALAALVSSTTAHSLFRGPRIFSGDCESPNPLALSPKAEVLRRNDDYLSRRQLSATPTLSATTPSSPFTISSAGTGFGGSPPTGTSPHSHSHHGHETGHPSGSGAHHRGGTGRKTRSRKFPRQFPSITASTYGSSPTTSLSPFNETTSVLPSETSFSGGAPTGFPTASNTGFPTGGPYSTHTHTHTGTREHSGTRHPHPSQTFSILTLSFSFPSGTGTAPFSFPTTGVPFPPDTTGAPSFYTPTALPSTVASATESAFPSAAHTTFATSVLSFGG